MPVLYFCSRTGSKPLTFDGARAYDPVQVQLCGANVQEKPKTVKAGSHHAKSPSSPTLSTAARALRRKGPSVAPPVDAAAAILLAPQPRSILSAADIGSMVRTTRTRLKINQQEFADLAGVGRRFISELEAGKPTLEFDRVLRVCAAAGIDVSAAPRA